MQRGSVELRSKLVDDCGPLLPLARHTSQCLRRTVRGELEVSGQHPVSHVRQQKNPADRLVEPRPDSSTLVLNSLTQDRCAWDLKPPVVDWSRAKQSMTSSISWLDQDSAAAERSLRILSCFEERESRDELGLAAT